VRIRPERASRSFPRLAGLTDILRFDIAAWTRQFDNHQKTVTALGDDANAVRTRVPNQYMVDVIIRICQDEGEDQLEAHRMVLTRRGIEAIMPLPEVEPEPVPEAETESLPGPQLELAPPPAPAPAQGLGAAAESEAAAAQRGLRTAQV